MAKRKKTVNAVYTVQFQHIHGTDRNDRHSKVQTERTLVNVTFAQQLQIEKRLKEISRDDLSLNIVTFRYFDAPKEIMGDFICRITPEEYEELLQGVAENGMFTIGYQEHFKKPDPVLRN